MFPALAFALAMLVSSGNTLDASPAQLSYDAIKETPRRKQPLRDTRTEDRVLRIEQRDQMNSNARDVRRNNLIGRWMIGKHLDFVSDIIIRIGGKDDGLKRALDELLRTATARSNFDIAGRFSLDQYIRIAEAGRTCEGDFGTLKLNSGHVQGIEADCIRDPRDLTERENWHNGVRINPRGGRHVEYALWQQTRYGGWEFDKKVPARNFHLHGYFDRIKQVRGVTPLSTALNALAYIYDAREYIHAKIRVHSLLGFKFTKAVPEDTEEDEQSIGPTVYEDDSTEELDEALKEKARARIKFVNGVANINLDEGEDLEFLESRTPPNELLNFLRFDVMLVMLSLDLPFNWLDPSQSNFFGGKGALQLYQRSATHKQRDNIDLKRWWLFWKLREAIIAGRLTLPSGMTIADLPIQIFARSVPWWDKQKELTGDLIGISAGIDNPIDVAQAHDRDFYENVDQTAAAVEYARQKLEPLGMRLNFDRPQLTPTLKHAEDVDA